MKEEDGEKPSSLLVLRKGWGSSPPDRSHPHSFCPFIFPGLLLDHHPLSLRDHDGEVGGRMEGYWDCLGGVDSGIGTPA